MRTKPEILEDVKEEFPMIWNRVQKLPEDKQFKELRYELSALSCECDHAEGYVCEACVMLADIDSYNQKEGDEL